jgi:cephalosporin hydroxylase
MAMQLIIDTEKSEVVMNDGEKHLAFPLASAEAFNLISQAWLRCGWDAKYVYAFTWLGRPIIQLPEDMLRIQEVIYRIKPDVVIETGIAHGGSLIFYASLFKAMGKGRVIGVDIEIRPHNRREVESHELFEYITLIEGSSIAPETVQAVDQLIKPSEKVLVILDSNHTKEHVLAELRAYSKFVSVGSYIVACDGIMGHLQNAPRTQPDWEWNNPENAAQTFSNETTNFVVEEPEFAFNEGMVNERVTYWPNGFLRRTK